MNPKGRAFVLAAYNMENMRLATVEESRGSGVNHRYVAKSGTLHDAFRGAILVEMDSQIPDSTAVRERLNSKIEQWVQEAMQEYETEVAKIAEGGISYSTDEAELKKMLVESVNQFMGQYVNYVLSGDFNQISSEDVLKRLSEHSMISSLTATKLPYSLQARPGVSMELFKEAITLPHKLSNSIFSKCEAAVTQLFQEYNKK
jgi:hypothetical protein